MGSGLGAANALSPDDGRPMKRRRRVGGFPAGPEDMLGGADGGVLVSPGRVRDVLLREVSGQGSGAGL